MFPFHPLWTLTKPYIYTFILINFLERCKDAWSKLLAIRIIYSPILPHLQSDSCVDRRRFNQWEKMSHTERYQSMPDKNQSKHCPILFIITFKLFTYSYHFEIVQIENFSHGMKKKYLNLLSLISFVRALPGCSIIGKVRKKIRKAHTHMFFLESWNSVPGETIKALMILWMSELGTVKSLNIKMYHWRWR